jgi:hypothetical protein
MLSRRTIRRPGAGAFQIPVWTVLPCHGMSRGSPTLTESKRAIVFSSLTAGASPPSILAEIDACVPGQQRPRSRGATSRSAAGTRNSRTRLRSRAWAAPDRLDAVLRRRREGTQGSGPALSTVPMTGFRRVEGRKRPPSREEWSLQGRPVRAAGIYAKQRPPAGGLSTPRAASKLAIPARRRRR